MTIRRQLLHGTIWTTAGIYGSSAISFAVTLVLARILAPADFGLIAAVVAFTGVLEAIADIGIGSSIVQRQDLDEGELSSLFWAILAGACAIYAALALGAPLLARLLQLPLLPRVLPVIGVNAILYGFLTIPLALARQRKQFKEAAVVQTLAVAVAGIAAVALAAAGFGYRALVAQTVLVVAARTIGLWRIARWRPRFLFRASDLAHATEFSGPVIAAVLINTWSRNLDAIFVARLAGVTALGHYNLAMRLIGAPLSLITGGVRSQLHPLFAPIRDDPDQIRGAFRETVALTAVLSFSVAALLWVVAEPLVLGVWGTDWAPTIPILRAFAILGAVQPISSLSNSLYLTQGRTALMLRIVAVNAIVLIAAMAIGVTWRGATGVAWAYSLVYALFSSPRLTLTAYVRLFGGTASDLLRSMKLPALFGIAIVAAGIATDAALVHLGMSYATRLTGIITATGLTMLLVARIAAWPLVLRVVRAVR